MIAVIAVGLLTIATVVAAKINAALKPPPPPVAKPCCDSASRVRLSDGRHLAFKERGVSKNKARHTIIVAHAFSDSKHFHFPISQEFLEELGINILSYDRAGYGESDPNPKRSVRSEALDIQELADKLQLGSKFYVMGLSLGAYSVYGCLKYIPHRLSGAALIVPLANYWWRCLPTKISGDAFRGLLAQDRWTFRVAHYAPWLLYWWMTQTWFPSLSACEGKIDGLSHSDREILKQLEKAEEQSRPGQNVHESLCRDLMVGFGKWEFEPTDIADPFPNKEGCVHLWQGYEDKVFPIQLSRCIWQELPWIRYHEVADAGHLLIYNATHCEAIFRALVSP